MFETSDSSSLDTSINNDSSDSDSTSFLVNCSSSASSSADSSSSSSPTIKSINTRSPNSVLLPSSCLGFPSTISYFQTFHTIFIHVLSKSSSKPCPKSSLNPSSHALADKFSKTSPSSSTIPLTSIKSSSSPTGSISIASILTSFSSSKYSR